MKKLILLIIIAMVIISCNLFDSSDDDNSENDNLLCGTWVKDSSYNDTTILKKSNELNENKYGFIIYSNGEFVERKNAGWCGTPPISYANYDGRYIEKSSNILEITIQENDWSGESRTRINYIEIISVDSNRLLIRHISAQEIDMQRELDILNNDVTIVDVESYYSMYQYGNTLKMYNLKNQNTVIKINIDNESVDFNIVAEVNIFEENVTEKLINDWINNQHSDAIVPEVPNPIGTYSMPEQSYSIISQNYINHTVGHYGDEYDNYDIKIYFINVINEGIYNLKSFTAEASVHVLTKNINNQ